MRNVGSFSLHHHCVRKGSGTHLGSYALVTVMFLPGDKGELSVKLTTDAQPIQTLKVP
jgi:hypothetical protein